MCKNMVLTRFGVSFVILIFTIYPYPFVHAKRWHTKTLTIFKWNFLTFCSSKLMNETNDTHIPVPIDVDYHEKSDRVFITIPRFGEGRPFTLGTVNQESQPEMCIQEYPEDNWEVESCSRLVSVYRVAIDKFDRLWVLDTGKNGNSQDCPPKLLAFNLTTNEVIHTANITDFKNDSLHVTPIIDVKDDINDTFVYIADVTGYEILVYSLKENKFWRKSNRFLYPYPSEARFEIEGESFILMDGVLGMALSKDELYVHSLASVKANRVNTSLLKLKTEDETEAEQQKRSFFYQQTEIKGQKDSQSAAQAVDRHGILYFGLMNPPRIACWNTENEEMNETNIHTIADDKNSLQFASGMKIVERGTFQELWVLTSRFQKVMNNNNFNDKETNFRILKIDIDTDKCHNHINKDQVGPINPNAYNYSNRYSLTLAFEIHLRNKQSTNL